jgi:hypothetical protein
VFERDAIRGITLAGRQARLVLQSKRERIELSGLGSREERLEGAAGLRAELGLAEAAASAATAANGSALPGEWEIVITPEGERALVPNPRTRRIQARVAALVALGLAAVTLLLARESIGRIDLLIATLICLTFTAGAAAGALWLARGRWEWRIGHGRLTRRKRYGSSVRDEFEGRHLLLECTNDSDGDSWYELHALAEAGKPTIPAAIQWRSITPKNSRTIARVMDDDASVRELAAFLARETGLELEDRTTPQARALELAELRAMLESSGTLGRWAAKMVERLGPAKGRE